MKKRLLSLLLVLVMALSLLPTVAFATATEVADADGFAEAIAAGGEIVLGADITYESAAAVTIVGETTIDLNGHTLDITTPSSERYSINVGVYGDSEPTLIIKDSSQEGTGVLNVKNTYTSRAAYIFGVYGTLDIQGGTINQTATKASSYGINMETSGTFKMSGGTIKKGTSIGSGYSLRTSTSSTSTITGGVIEDYYGTTGLQISGGVFKTEPTYEMMKPDFVTYKITDEGATKGWYGVKEGTYVGLVGTTVYTDVASFANAIGGNKISVEGTKLTLTDDVNLGSASANKVTFLSDITIDLAGHNITGAVTGSSAYMFYINQKDATVTITDSGEEKGKVENSTSGYCYTVMVNYGTLVVDGAKIVGKTTGTSTTTVITNGSTSSSTPKVVLKNGAVISVENGNTAKSSSTGIQNYGICEIDDSTIEVTSGSGATAVNPYNSSSVLKIGKNSTVKSTIKAVGTGKNTTQATTMCVIGNGSKGGSGDIYISNADIILTTDKGESTTAQTCYAVNLGSAANGTYEIGDNVSISASGTCGTANEVYGLRAEGGGKISGSNVSIDVEGENASKRYGLYLTNKTNLTFYPGTNVTVEVNKNSCEGGTNYISYASSDGKFAISGGTYKGGTLNGIFATGGTFDSDPSSFCDLGYVAEKDNPSTGLWTVVPDTRTIVKNLTQDKEYGNIVTAVAEAKDHDELQLMDDISSNSELTLASINLDLNGHDISLSKINTTGDVTITDKQATSYDNAGKLTAAINVGAGQTTISKCSHEVITNNYKLKPFVVGGTADAPAQLIISGVQGAYDFTGTATYYVIQADANSRVTIGDAEGFETDLALNSEGQSPKLVYGSTDNCATIINGGKFSITCTNSTAGTCSVFNNNATALVNGGKFTLNSTKSNTAKIAENTNANINIQGGYYAATASEGEVSQNDFFANATTLGVSNGKSAAALAEDDPMYKDGYRYTVKAVAVATANSGQEYFSIEAAINAAANTDKTVKLLADIVLTEYTLDKNVTFEANGHTVKLNGNKPLTLAAGIEKPECFDVSDAVVYIEKNNGEKIYYKYWQTYGSPNTGAIIDYNADEYRQIVLTKDMNVSSSLTVYKTCTIDLNGFSINGNGCQSETVNIKKGSGEATPTVCTIVDSSEGKTGKITGNNDKYYTVLIEGTGNALVLESGTIENTSENGAGICAMDSYGYNICKDATITINGGKVTTNDGFAIVDNGQYSKNITINVNGGEIQSTGVAIYHPADGVITLNGGTITGGTAIYMRSGKLVVPADSTVQVFANGAKGGRDETSGRAYMTGDAVVIDNTAGYPGGAVSADVKGGRFASDNAKAMASYKTGAVSAISGFLSGGYYSSRPESALIKEGYTAISYKDNAYPELHWVIGDIPEINVGEATVDEESKAITIGGETITVTDGEGQSVVTQEAADAITGMLNNDAVADFSGTNIDNATNKEKVTDGSYDITKVMKALMDEANSERVSDTTAAVTGDDQITVTTNAGDDVFNETDIKKQVTVDLTSSKVESVAQPQSSAVTTVTSSTFDVKPIATITTVDENGDAVVIKTQIPNDAITSDITFRLPVDAHMTVDSTMVYHSDTLENLKKDCLGVFPIQEENGKKFIELSASEFSFYTYEDLNVSADSVAVIIDNAGNYTGYDALADAIAAFNAGTDDGVETTVDNAVSIILLKDVNGSADFGSKVMTLDLNGCKLIGSVENATNVTVTNTGDTQKTLAATGVYKNDVSAFVMDGFDAIDYDTATEGIDYRKVINNTAAGIFSVVVVPVPGSYTDRDSVTTNEIDLYAGDTIKMDVRVYGAKFVGADVTLYYDKTNFKMVDAPVSGWDGDVKWYDGDDASKLAGKTRFYAAKSTQSDTNEYYNLNKIDNDGNMYYSLGTFEFEALPGANEALKVAFQVEPTVEGQIGRNGTTGQDVAPVYVAGAWSQGWNDTPANQLATGAEDTHLVNALVNVRLKSMSAVVNGETGLVYNTSARNLVKSGAGAKDSITQQAIPNPTIKYAVLTKAEADKVGTQKKDEGGNPLYIDPSDSTKTTTTENENPALYTLSDFGTSYTDAVPQQTDAGDYVVFYRVSKDGYITVSDKLNVSIAKKDVDLNWTFGSGEDYKTGDDTTTEIVSDFYIAYTEGNTEGYSAPVAKYDNAGGGESLTADVTLTSFNDADPADGTKLIKVGKYVYTATVDPNYNIKSGETKVVEVTGAHIEGYTLTAKNNTTAAPTIGNVWYDSAAHTPAQLNKATGATEDVTIKYHTLKPGDTEWTVSDTIPEFTTAGTYQVKAVLTKDSYYDLTLDTVTFTIKAANYVVEKFDWVTGWDVVLVYTNDAVPGFTYDGAKMYDVSALGYKYGTTKNADGTVGTQGYTHVFGLVVFGDADITKVTSGNETALDINYSTMEGNMPSGVAKARLDVNSSSSVELLDLVFVQGVYNVNETYMAQQMANVLKSDVNGDKMVDTRDCALIKANS